MKSSKPLPKASQKSLELGGVIVLLTCIAYLPTLQAGFIWDDDAHVVLNHTLRSLDGLKRIWLDPGATPQYYPLVHTSFWFEFHLWGVAPLGFHIVNVALHCLAALLLWRILRLLGLPAAWLTAAIFAVHPVCVESVAWVTERKNVLAAALYFGAALAYLRFDALFGSGLATVGSSPVALPSQCPPPQSKENARRSWFWYAMALFLFVLSLFSKTVTCSLPAALLLVAWWRHGRVSRREILLPLPFFAVGATLALHTSWLEKNHVGASGGDWTLSVPERILVAGRALWFYAGKLVWPSNLTFIYPRWELNPQVWWQWLFPAAAITGALTLWALRSRIGKGPLVAVLVFAGTLVPALGFFNVYPMRYSFVADHFQYLAAAGLLCLGAAGLRRLPWNSGLAVLPVLLALTWRQSHIYQNPETLWTDTLSKNPTCWMAHNNLGEYLRQQRRLVEAAAQFRESIRLRPDNAEAWNNLGVVSDMKDELTDAKQFYRKAIELKPNYTDALANLASVLGSEKRYDESLELYERALKTRPDYPALLRFYGNTLLEAGKIDEAIEKFHEALRYQPTDRLVLDSLARAEAKKAGSSPAGAIP